MDKKLNRLEIVEKFLKLEQQKKLLNLQIRNVYPWQISRVWLFLDLLIFFGGDSNHNQVGESLSKKIKKITRIVLNSIFKNPFFDFRRSEILLFQSSRKYNFNHRYIDIYTHHITENFKNEHKNVMVYETVSENFDNNFTLDFKSNNKHLDFLRICVHFIQLFIRPKFNKKELSEIEKLQHSVKIDFGVDLNISTIFKDSIKQFKAECLMYDLLFRIKKPKEIYIVSSSDKSGMIFAAKRYNIIVNELQHGFNSDKDVILNYPNTPEDSLSYFPDRFFIWDNVKMFFAKLPLSDKNIFKIPNYHLKKMLQDYRNVIKEDKTILIISQPFGSDEIFNFVLKNLPELTDYKIYYKIHPVESKSKKFEKLDQFKNVFVVENQESLYLLMKKSKFVLGIYSSALYEAVVFDCGIILLNLPGVEMSMNLLENSNCKLADTQSSLRSLLDYKI